MSLPGSPVFGPVARGHFGITYDAQSEKTVLSGGVQFRDGALVYCEDFWSWDGESWERSTAPGLAIMGQRLSCDEKRGRVLMLGGSARDAQAGAGLREWTTTGWKTLGGPEGLKGDDPGFCYDSVRDILVAVIPDAAHRSLAVWTLSDRAWTRAAEELPEPRSFFATAYDAKRKQVVLFGGRIEDKLAPADVWLFDGAQWEKKTPTGPSARAAAGMVYDDELGAIVMHGGMSADFHWLSDTWSWNGTSWTKLSDAGPAIEFGMTYDGRRDRVVLVGAPSHEEPDASLEVWECDGKTWAKMTPTVARDQKSK